MAKAIAKAETGVIDMSKLTKENVPNLIAQLESQKEKLTSGVNKEISTDVTYNGKNIKSIDKVSELLEISASIHARSEAFTKEISRYGLDSSNISTFKTEKHTVEEWELIIKKAIHELINSSKLKKLEASISKLSQFLSEDEKLQRELKDILESATSTID